MDASSEFEQDFYCGTFDLPIITDHRLREQKKHLFIRCCLRQHGGFAYAGQRVIFHASGTYEVQRYTDVVGDDTVSERGTYQRQDSAFVLSHAGVQSVYRIVTVGRIEYLLIPSGSLASQQCFRSWSN